MGVLGRTGRRAGLAVALAVVGGLAVGWRHLKTSTVTAAESRSASAALSQVFLPLIQNYVVPFQDDFSNPNSGWATLQSSLGTWGYVNGEYRIQVLQPQFELRVGHNLLAGDFQAHVSARSDTPNNAGYGLYFASDSTRGRYVFNVNPWLGNYALYRWDLTLNPPTSVMLINYTINAAILTGSQTNVLEVRRAGPVIMLYANGHRLARIVDSTLGTGTVGLIATSFASAPPAEAFYDNFSFVGNATQPLPAAVRPGVGVGQPPSQDAATGSASLAGTDGSR